MLKPFNIFLFYFLSLLTPWVHSPNLSSLAVSFTPTSDLPTNLASNLSSIYPLISLSHPFDLSFDLTVTSRQSHFQTLLPISFFLIYLYGIPYNFFFFFCCSGLILVVNGWFCMVIGSRGLWWVSCGWWDILYLFIYFYIYCRRVF